MLHYWSMYGVFQHRPVSGVLQNRCFVVDNWCFSLRRIAESLVNSGFRKVEKSILVLLISAVVFSF